MKHALIVLSLLGGFFALSATDANAVVCARACIAPGVSDPTVPLGCGVATTAPTGGSLFAAATPGRLSVAAIMAHAGRLSSVVAGDGQRPQHACLVPSSFLH